MAASLPGSTAVENAANPSVGRAVIFDLLSGPKGSPFGGRTLSFDANGHPVYAADATNLSTGGLSNGIGFGSPPVIDPIANAGLNNAVLGIRAAGFTDDYKPGISTPVPADAADSTFMYIGGGKSDVNGLPVPYTAGFGIGMAGNGGSRDAGAGPAFTGFGIKTVTATADVANGAAVEAGWLNRSGQTIVEDQSVFGSSTAASAAPV